MPTTEPQAKPPKSELPQLPKTDPPKTELPQIPAEPPKTELPAEPPKTELPQLPTEPLKTEPPKTKPPKTEPPKTDTRRADWDYKLRRAVLWDAGKQVFSTEFLRKTPELKGESRVLAKFAQIGLVEVAGATFWMTEAATVASDELTPVIRKTGKDRTKATAIKTKLRKLKAKEAKKAPTEVQVCTSTKVNTGLAPNLVWRFTRLVRSPIRSFL